MQRTDHKGNRARGSLANAYSQGTELGEDIFGRLQTFGRDIQP